MQLSWIGQLIDETSGEMTKPAIVLWCNTAENCGQMEPCVFLKFGNAHGVSPNPALSLGERKKRFLLFLQSKG